MPVQVHVGAALDLDSVFVTDVHYAPGCVQRRVEPELPYLAVFLEGGVEKRFPRKTLRLERGGALAMPVGETHDARFGAAGARVVIVKPRRAAAPAAAGLRILAPVAGRGVAWLAWRLAAELRAADAAAPLAAEGLALELLAAAARQPQERARRPGWLGAAEELLRSRTAMRLGEVASAVGVQPTQLARAFRAHHGVSVGEFSRRLRLEWAATELARGELGLAEIAAEAGFADQSHFTRCFKQSVGTTPACYRESTRVLRR